MLFVFWPVIISTPMKYANKVDIYTIDIYDIVVASKDLNVPYFCEIKDDIYSNLTKSPSKYTNIIHENDIT